MVGGCGCGNTVDVVLMVVLWAERNLGVVVVAEGGEELTRRRNDRITFEERPLGVIAINGSTVMVDDGDGWWW